MLDREQLAAASVEERSRALRSERQAALRQTARRAREQVLRGDSAAARALRTDFLPLLPVEPDACDDDPPDPPALTARQRTIGP
jgi:hypothetical protein